MKIVGKTVPRKEGLDKVTGAAKYNDDIREPVAIVVADTEYQAQQAAYLINVEYEPLPVVRTPSQAIEEGAPLIHENLGHYGKEIDDVYPVPGTNIAIIPRFEKVIWTRAGKKAMWWLRVNTSCQNQIT